MKINNKKDYYFTEETETAIIDYNLNGSSEYRNILLKEYIIEPFEKIITYMIYSKNLFNTGFDVDTLKRDALGYMVDQIKNYSVNKGKAFSYFEIVARNWLTNKNITGCNQRNKYSEIDYKVKEIEDKHNDLDTNYYHFIEFIDDNYEMLTTNKTYLHIIEILLIIMKKTHCMSNFNKKSIVIQIKEICDCDSVKINYVFKLLKHFYWYFNKYYTKTTKKPNGEHFQVWRDIIFQAEQY